MALSSATSTFTPTDWVDAGILRAGEGGRGDVGFMYFSSSFSSRESAANVRGSSMRRSSSETTLTQDVLPTRGELRSLFESQTSLSGIVTVAVVPELVDPRRDSKLSVPCIRSMIVLQTEARLSQSGHFINAQ